MVARCRKHVLSLKCTNLSTLSNLLDSAVERGLFKCMCASGSEDEEQRPKGETCVCCSLLGQNLNQVRPTQTSFTFSLKSFSLLSYNTLTLNRPEDQIVISCGRLSVCMYECVGKETEFVFVYYSIAG